MHWQLNAQALSAAILLPGYLLIAGFLTMLFTLKVHTDGKYHPTWKDRPDGRYVRSSPAIQQITPFIPDGTEICGMADQVSGLFWHGAKIPAGAESVPWQYLFYLYGQPGHQAGLPPSL